MRSFNKHHFSFILATAALLAVGIPFSFALAEDETISEEISTLNQEIAEKKGNIEQINRQIKEYEKKIDQKQAERASFTAQLEIIENRIAKTELEIEETNTEMDLVNQELVLIERELTKLQNQLDKDRELIAGILQEMQVDDHSLPLQVFFGAESFSELFDRIDQLETINDDLQAIVEEVKASQVSMGAKKEAQNTKHDQLEDLQKNLQKEMLALSESVEGQEILIQQTRRSESEFQALLRETKEEQQYIDQQINALQSEIEGKLSASDQAGDTGALSWPLIPKKGISTYFHDPTYPFRNLFEHSGLDLPAPTGTPIKSVAPGYVAWTRKGRQYGNYVMVIHANGLATLYAHMSRIDVEPDQFVGRGTVLGAVGSTGLSTGPHLHLEVRKNGIPTDPMNYLIAQ